LIERAQRRDTTRIGIWKERIQTHEQVHRLLQKGMTFLFFGPEGIVACLRETGALSRRLVTNCFAERSFLVVAPRFVGLLDYLVGHTRDDLSERVPQRRFVVKTPAPPFFDGAL